MAVDPRTASTNAQIRRATRIGGVLVLALGLFLFIDNGAKVIHGIQQSDTDFNAEGPSIGTVLATMGGFLLIGIGLQLLYVGFLRTAASYMAGEASPAVRSVSGDVLLGVDDVRRGGADASGPFCSACGVRNDAAARFCDACGAPLAPR